MVEINFDDVEDVQDFTPVPEGEYMVKVADVTEDETQYGDDIWGLKLEIINGEYSGRYVFDNMVFSEKALKRVKLICSRLGIDTSGTVDLTPDMLMDKQCAVDVVITEYITHNEEGAEQKKKKNSIPFAGYKRVGDAGQDMGGEGDATTEDTPDLPF